MAEKASLMSEVALASFYGVSGAEMSEAMGEKPPAMTRPERMQRPQFGSCRKSSTRRAAVLVLKTRAHATSLQRRE